MSYSGNPSLSSDVKTRILSTFDQTLTLAREGNRQEALLGCDFVLRMDPLFQPAQVLQDRLRSSAGPVQVDDLQAAAPAAAVDPFADLDSLSLELPDLLPDPGQGAAALRNEWQSLLDQRRFQEVMSAALREHAAVAVDPELQRIAGLAQERMEAEPYIQKFLSAARQAAQSGNTAEVGRLLDKVRSLDASHPGIAELERPSPAPAAAAPAFAIPAPTTMPGFAFPTGKTHDAETERRIQELLNEGQAAFDSGDAQGAIDAWSRIFLIDIDHPEASRRIEGARKLKAENERQVEEIFHDGLARLEDGDLAAARRAFQRVLEIQPGYYAAREYLQQLESGNVPSAKPASLQNVPPPAPLLPLPSDLGLSDHDPLKEEILVPPDPSEQAAVADRKPARKAAGPRGDSRARRLFVLVGGAVLLLALAAGAYVFLNKDTLFPNSAEETVAPGTPGLATDPISRAQRLHQAGKTAIALNQLRRLPPTDSQYAEAQKLIAEWGGGQAASAAPAAAPAATDAAPAATPAGAPAGDNRRLALLAAARQSYSDGVYLKARTRFEQAAAIAKLEEADAQLLTDAKRRLEPLAKQIDLFRQHEWEFVIRELWDLHESDPGNRDVTQLLADSYYNLAVRDLQRNDAPKAVENLKEALQLQGGDPNLQRHYQFAQTYQDRPKDLLYKIYVKYLPFRG